MRKVFVLAVLSLGSAALVHAQDELLARSYGAGRSQRLSPPSTAAPAAIMAQFLKSKGVPAATVGTLKSVATQRAARTGLTHVRMEQYVNGLRVVNAYVKATLTDRGELVNVIESVARVASTKLGPARINARKALQAALQTLHAGAGQNPTLLRTEGNTTIFAKGTFFHAPPAAEQVAIPTNGALKAGFRVETWTVQGNLLHNTLVDASGRVLAIELRTNTDSYNIFPDHPANSTQTVVAGPGAGNAQSPSGWLFGGAQGSINIAGNNAHAYLDADANGAPDAGGSPVADGNFLTSADLTVSPSTATNRNVAVQNLFYLNNVIHDTLYSHGFDEAAGNFQENNFGLGGRGSDSVNAEAQDGAGTDNANFATPRDGQNPRMQMFLWSGRGDNEVVVNSPASIAGIYRAQGAAFGPALNATGLTADVVLANDGTGTTSDACETIVGSLSGKIALIDRGTCAFVVKVKNVQNAGASGAIVANNAGDSIFTMGGTDATITIPSVFIGQTDGTTIKSELAGGVNATERLKTPAPLQRDGDLDSDIVWHEYGHGLTWRMIGRMDGPMSGAIGEGMSDVLSILINNDDVVGEYSFDDPIGIRTARYTNYPRTYGDVAGTEVHFDGEVYGAIGWRLWEIFQREGLPKDLLLGYLVDGMNFTTAHPKFENMRDGILQSVANSGSGHDCLIWEAFAGYGVGVGAKATVRGSSVIVTESFTLPSQCP